MPYKIHLSIIEFIFIISFFMNNFRSKFFQAPIFHCIANNKVYAVNNKKENTFPRISRQKLNWKSFRQEVFLNSKKIISFLYRFAQTFLSRICNFHLNIFYFAPSSSLPYVSGVMESDRLSSNIFSYSLEQELPKRFAGVHGLSLHFNYVDSNEIIEYLLRIH